MKTTTRSAARWLGELESLKARYGDGSAARKAELLRQLGQAPLASAAQVLRLHEAACFLKAIPDDAQVLAAAERLLERFARRADLRRWRRALDSSGIAGTDTSYPFFAPTARRLVERCGSRVRVDWAAFDQQQMLEDRLPLLATYSETPGLDEYAMPVRRWVQRLKGPSESDAQFLVQRLARLGASSFERDTLYDELGLPLTLRWGPAAPSRTHERLVGQPIHFQTRPLHRTRPDVRRELARPPLAVRDVDEREGARIVELAQDAMVNRQRDLDAFIHGDARDVRMVDCGEGLEFACIGVKPERRLLLESVYGLLTLKNGVPIGYVLTSALFASSEIAYNVFDTWRGGEAGHVYGRLLAATHRLFGSQAFTIYPYQLGGDGNTEGLKSGAWWFYQKLGFRSRDPRVLQLMRRELAAMRRDPARRSDIQTLRRLARGNVFWFSGRPRTDVIGLIALEQIGLAVTDYLARRFGADRERGERQCAAEAARLCGVRLGRGLTAGQRLGWTRWSPLILALPGVERWSLAERRGLARVALAKGGRRESDFVRLCDAHRPLRAALRRLARTT